jgi:hypothetical protein
MFFFTLSKIPNILEGFVCPHYKPIAIAAILLMVVKIGNLERRKKKDWIHDKLGMREQRTLEIGMRQHETLC